MKQVQERVLQILQEQFSGVAIEPRTSFDGIGCDSLDAVELVMSIEDEFDISIPDEDFYRVARYDSSVADIIELLKLKGDAWGKSR